VHELNIHHRLANKLIKMNSTNDNAEERNKQTTRLDSFKKQNIVSVAVNSKPPVNRAAFRGNQSPIPAYVVLHAFPYINKLG
jgi:hypothetical protein